MRGFVIGLFLVAGLAGCLGGDSDDGDDRGGVVPVRDPAWAKNALVADHDHADRALHMGLTTPNIEVIGHDWLVTDYHGAPSGGYYCGEVSTGERRLAVVNSFTSNTAIVIVDVTDPAAPQMVGELILPNTHIYDSAITDDGRFAILATSPLDALFPDPNDPLTSVHASGADLPGPTYGVRPVFRDACGNERVGPLDVLPYASGVLLVDLRDPTVPAVADFRPRPAIGPHSVQSATLDGTVHILASTTNLAYTASTFSFFTLVEHPAGALLLDQGEFNADYSQQFTGGGLLLNGHVDGTVHKHPLTNATMAYLANWDGGLIVTRIDGPGQITRIGGWGARDASAGSGMTGQIHTAYPLDTLIDGRAILIVGQELGGRPAERPTGQITVLDITDPTAPMPVARWTAPVDIVGWGGLTFSTHYVAVTDGVLWTALYHGGLWAADLDPKHWPNLPSLGVFLPAEEPPAPPATGGPTPEILDVLPLPDGSVVTFDATTGAYTLRLDRSVAVPPALGWEGDVENPGYPGN